MTKLIFTLLFLVMGNVAYGAELLVMAHDTTLHKKGDVVVVRPDGWKWGTSECLPDFIVVKLDGVSYDDAKKYEEPLTKDVIVDGKTEKQIIEVRKYSIPVATVDTAKTDSKSVVTIASRDSVNYSKTISEKTVLVEAIKE